MSAPAPRPYVAEPPAAVGRARTTRAARAGMAVLVRMSLWVVAFAVLAAAIAVLFILRRGDETVARRIATRELAMSLDRGEVVHGQAAVEQRQWWDYYRPTHGVIAVTDRRVVFVGVAPPDLLPHEPEPPALVTISIPYAADHHIDVQLDRVFFGSARGFMMRAPSEPMAAFAFNAAERARGDAVLQVLARRQGDMRTVADAERRAALDAAEAARRPDFHRVQRGEALDLIAARYGRTADQLRTWNRLPSNLIKIGQVLMVKPWT